MVTPQRRIRGAAARAATGVNDNRNVQVDMVRVPVDAIRQYEWNPRDNEAAVESVANSIKLVGFVVPVILDANNVLVAGHTRHQAALLLGLREVPAIYVEHLSQAQIDAFRLIDNKVSELAKWDFDLLAGEIGKLRDTGIQLTDFGWTRPELDCLSAAVQDDCLSTANLVDAESRDRLRRQERRAPATARFVLGELVFFIPASDYRLWADGIRALHDFNEQAIVADLKRRLGITVSSE